MIALLVLAIRVNRVVAKATDVVGMISQYIMLPFTYLAGLFARGGQEDVDETPTRKRTTKSKK